MSKYASFLENITQIVGSDGLLTAFHEIAQYIREERGLYHGQAMAVVQPASTTEVAAVVRLCANAHVPLVPQGGNTGLVGGGVPWEHGAEIVLSTKRLKQVRAIDSTNYTITVEAGCSLADVRKAATAVGCFFPLSLGAEERCHIGGNLATNAGGVNVLHYGMVRDLTLGLEVVLPDGRVWNGLRALTKDNSGYALKHLFIGAEGTLGIITAAVLKLFPQPYGVETTLCALPHVEKVLPLLERARTTSGDMVTAFELVSHFGLTLALRHLPSLTSPFVTAWPWYVLMELSTSNPTVKLRTVLDTVLECSFTGGVIKDAVIASSIAQATALWQIRDGLPEAQKREGGSIKHDISVPVSRIPEFLIRAIAAVTAAVPGVRVCAFGHAGDGNIHFNLSQPLAMDRKTFLAKQPHLNRVVHDIIAPMGGSISAEHGIGRMKREEMAYYKDLVELDLMRQLKRAIDPQNIMNPGKVV